jgi:hypothetical protein
MSARYGIIWLSVRAETLFINRMTKATNLFSLVRKCFMSFCTVLVGKSEYKLPVIVPIVIYNGTRPWTVPERYREYLLKSQEFDGLLYDFNYIIIDIHRLDEEKLMEQSNLISIIFALDRSDDIMELLARLKILLVKVKKLPILEQTLFWDWLLRILKPRLTKEEQQLLELLINNANEGEDEMITNIEVAWQRSLDEKYIEGKQ